MPARSRLTRADRLTRSPDLLAVRQAGMRIHIDDLDVRAILTARGASRVGFVVPKYKRSAVDRNRLKRRLRELVRTRFLQAWRNSETRAPDIDVVVRALPSAYQITMADLTRRIDRAYTVLHRRLTPQDR